MRLGLFLDHTSEACDWHLPLAHYLEGWGDAEAGDGTLCCVQPLIAPLNGAKPPRRRRHRAPAARRPHRSRSAGAADAVRRAPTDGKPATSYFVARRRPRTSWSGRRSPSGPASRHGRQSSTPSSTATSNSASCPPTRTRPPASRSRRRGEAREVAKATRRLPADRRPRRRTRSKSPSTRTTRCYDGRFAMNPWLQELPDPITKLVWDNAAIVSPKTAAEFRLKHGDRVEAHGRTAPRSTCRCSCCRGRPTSRSRWRSASSARCGSATCPTAAAPTCSRLRKSDALHIVAGCKLEPTGRTADLVTTQEHGVIPEGRDIIARSRSPNTAKHTARARRTRTRTSARPEDRLPARRPPHRGGPQEGLPGRLRQPAAAAGPATREAGAVPARPRPPRAARQPVPVGHGDRPQRLHRLLGVHGRVPGREQHPGRRQARGEAQPRDALDPHRPLLLLERPHAPTRPDGS